MITFVLLLGLFMRTACVAEIAVPMPRGTYRFPVDLRTPANDSFTGVATLALSQQNSHVINRQLSQPSVVISSYGFVGQTRAPRFEFLFRTRVGRDAAISMDFAANRDSPFAQNSSSGFLITPSSESEDLLIMNPNDPSEHAYEGLIYYAPIPPTFGAGFWGMDTTILITGQPPGASTQCVIDPTEKFLLPRHVSDEIVGRMTSLGISYAPRHPGCLRLSLFGTNPEIIAQMPTLEFSIISQDGSRVQIITLAPNDYLVPIPGTTILQTTFHHDSSGSMDRCQLNHYALKNLLIHIDAHNNRIGFGDPLVEL